MPFTDRPSATCYSFEFRLGDMSANPYLLQAAIIAAGNDGLDRNLWYAVASDQWQSTRHCRRVPPPLLHH